MSDSIDIYLTMQRELELMRDPFGIGKLQQQFERLGDPLGLASLQRDMEAMRDGYGLAAMYSELGRVPGMHGFSAVDRELAQMRGIYGLGAMQNELDLSTRVAGLGRLDEIFERTASLSFAERYMHHEESAYGRAFDLAASIGSLSHDVNRIAGGFSAVEAMLRENTNPSLLKLLETTTSLDRILAQTAPSAHEMLLKDLERSAAPWLAAHDALWPHDSMVLRMLGHDEAFGVASWLPEATTAAEPRHFQLGALASHVAEGDPIRIDHEVCCALCGDPVFAPSSEAHWIGPRRLRMRTNVVPICVPCSARDEREPGYLRESLLALVEAPPPAERLRFEVYEGDETDPVPRGRLSLVRDEPADPDDSDDSEPK